MPQLADNAASTRRLEPVVVELIRGSSPSLLVGSGPVAIARLLTWAFAPSSPSVKSDIWGVYPIPPHKGDRGGGARKVAQVQRFRPPRKLQRVRSVVAVCPVCGDVFSPKTPGKRGRPRKYCTDRCTKKVGRDSKSDSCARDGCDRPRRAKKLCVTHYNASFFKGSQRKYDTPEKKRARDQRRRAVVFGHTADLISRDRVGDRDGWVCGICRRDVDISLPWPDPKSPSLDHIVPLARGGRHTYSNVRISHLTCNVKRGCPVEV